MVALLVATVISRVAGMVGDPAAQQLAAQHGLRIQNVSWEDTGRFQGSSVGPNISDVTLEVQDGGERALMPVIRYENFTDTTADVQLDKFFVKVGNQSAHGEDQVISLRQLLAAPERYLSFPERGHIRGGTLLAPRDTHALVSAQAAFLPVPVGREATFYPVIFNYQSSPGNPAVLSILITRQGTSMSVVGKNSDYGSWGQRLFFNHEGQRAPLTAQRLSDVQADGVTANGESAASLGDDANLLMLIQVPLKHREPLRRYGYNQPMMSAPPPMAGAAPKAMSRAAEPDLETAVLGHGETEGVFSELDGLTIERDPRFPVRVTVQFYQATSNGRVGQRDMDRLAAQIQRVYEHGDYVGSLVVGDTNRPTAWEGIQHRRWLHGEGHIGLR